MHILIIVRKVSDRLETGKMELLVVDDHPLIRQGLRSIFQQKDADSVIWEAGSVKEAVRVMEQHEVSVALVDLHLNKESGFTLIEWMKLQPKKMKCIILSSTVSQSNLQTAKKLQVDGYVTKSGVLEDIIYAVKLVERGGQFFSPEVGENICKASCGEVTEKLTKREQEVWMLVQKGYTNAQIGKKLFISESTTKKHVSNLLSKLNLNHRVELAIYERGRRYEKVDIDQSVYLHGLCRSNICGVDGPARY